MFYNRSRDESVRAPGELGDELSQILALGPKENEANRLLEVSHIEIIMVEPML